MTTIKPNELMLVSTGSASLKVENIKKDLENTLQTNVIHYNQPIEQFADGSWNVEFKESVRGKIVYVYADCFSHEGHGDLNSKYMLYRHILNAATKNGAKSVNVIFPCYPYARSDRPDDPGLDQNAKRVSVMAPLVLQDMQGHGVKELITLDIHNSAVLGGAQGLKTTNLSYGRLVEQAIGTKDYTNIELGSTDEGGTKKIGKLAKQLGVNNYGASKERDNTKVNSVKKVFIDSRFAQITDKDIVVYDDMIDTGGTICEIVSELSKRHPNSIKIVSTHGMFHGDALQKLGALIKQGLVKEIYVSDSIDRSGLPDWVKVIPTSKIFANTIASILEGKSIDMNSR